MLVIQDSFAAGCMQGAISDSLEDYVDILQLPGVVFFSIVGLTPIFFHQTNIRIMIFSFLITL